MKLSATLTAFLTAAVLMLSSVAVQAASLSTELMDVLHEQGVITDASYDELKKTVATGGEESANRQLVELLYKNGTINEASYKRLSEAANHAAPQSSPAQPVAAATDTSRPVPQAFSEVEEGFARLGGGDIKLKIGAWVQGGFVYDDSGTNEGALPGSSTISNSGNSFQFRFARPYLNFAFKDKTGFRVMMDAADTAGKPLRDVFVWFDYIPYTRVTFGQFLTPFGGETWRAPFDNPMINYSLGSTLMQFTNFRDTGIMVAPKFKTEVAGRPFAAGLSTALIQGNGINASDDNDHKDVIGRAWVEPMVPGLQLAGSWYFGKSNNVTFDTDWRRWGAELNYAPVYAPGLAVRCEYLFQKKYYATPARYVNSTAWYAQAAYHMNGFDGGMKFLNDVEPTVRYEQLDEDTAVPDNTRTRLTLGINYWFNKYLRLMTNYEIITADRGLNPATGTTIMTAGKDIDRVDHNVLTSHLQIWF